MHNILEFTISLLIKNKNYKVPRINFANNHKINIRILKIVVVYDCINLLYYSEGEQFLQKYLRIAESFQSLLHCDVQLPYPKG